LRREREGRLSREESERAERVARLRAIAEQVFESAAESVDFLYSPHPLLGDAAPAELASTDLGARRVEDLLWKLEYSLPV
jgi:putative toxin-antitoxin system antitoxin component (TIGR02293 family)